MPLHAAIPSTVTKTTNERNGWVAFFYTDLNVTVAEVLATGAEWPLAPVA
jgi:hypothetical protein